MDALAVLAAPVLTEGIRFLCEQAKELVLNRRRGSEDAAAEVPDGSSATLPPAFTGTLDTASYDPRRLAELADALIAARSRLENHGSGLLPVDPHDADLRTAVHELRRLLEAVYGQHITFAGEDRSPSGTRVRGTVEVGEVAGKVTVTDIGRMTRGEVSAVGSAERVEAGGEFTGVRIERLGD